MQRVAFKMKLNNGCEAEYERRHDTLWPELKDLLKAKGINEYSIFLEKETNILFAYLTIENEKMLDELQHYPVMQRWWSYMKDIMETNDDNSPLSIPLTEVFYMP